MPLESEWLMMQGRLFSWWTSSWTWTCWVPPPSSSSGSDLIILTFKLQALYETWSPSEDKVSSSVSVKIFWGLTSFLSLFTDILSVLAMTYSDTQPWGTLRYCLLSASLYPSSSPLADTGTWGHEYVCHIAAELGEECSVREGDTLEQLEGANNSAKPDVKLLGTIEDLVRGLAKQCTVLSGP